MCMQLKQLFQAEDWVGAVARAQRRTAHGSDSRYWTEPLGIGFPRPSLYVSQNVLSRHWKQIEPTAGIKLNPSGSSDCLSIDFLLSILVTHILQITRNLSCNMYLSELNWVDRWNCPINISPMIICQFNNIYANKYCIWNISASTMGNYNKPHGKLDN